MSIFKPKRFFPNVVAADFFSVVTGDLLGSGLCRSVYASALDKTLVYKLEAASGHFQNIHEWQVWENVQHTRYAKWFAPCVDISPNGIVLTQRRTKPLTSADQMPDKIPAFFTDMKLENFGLLNGKVVCHDYGLTLLMSRGLSSALRKVDRSCL